jgi:hypothetical protein
VFVEGIFATIHCLQLDCRIPSGSSACSSGGNCIEPDQPDSILMSRPSGLSSETQCIDRELLTVLTSLRTAQLRPFFARAKRPLHFRGPEGADFLASLILYAAPGEAFRGSD